MSPTRAELEAARDRLLPDVVAPGLRVLFCGINPGLASAFTGHHFARPGNRFWPALHDSGFTPRRLVPAEQSALLPLGLGITNVVARATARADELSADELVEGGALLRAKVDRLRPAWLAVLGVTAYRSAFGVPRAVVGPVDEPWGDTRVWVLPNPSGLNAHWTPVTIAAELARLRQAAPGASGGVGAGVGVLGAGGCLRGRVLRGRVLRGRVLRGRVRPRCDAGAPPGDRTTPRARSTYPASTYLPGRTVASPGMHAWGSARLPGDPGDRVTGGPGWRDHPPAQPLPVGCTGPTYLPGENCRLPRHARLGQRPITRGPW